MPDNAEAARQIRIASDADESPESPEAPWATWCRLPFLRFCSLMSKSEIRLCRPCSSALIYGCKQRGRQSLRVAAEAVLKSSAPSLSAKYLRCGSLCGSLFKNDFYFRPLPPSEGSSDALRSVRGSTWCLGTWRGPLPSKEKESRVQPSPRTLSSGGSNY